MLVEASELWSTFLPEVEVNSALLWRTRPRKATGITRRLNNEKTSWTGPAVEKRLPRAIPILGERTGPSRPRSPWQDRFGLKNSGSVRFRRQRLTYLYQRAPFGCGTGFQSCQGRTDRIGILSGKDRQDWNPVPRLQRNRAPSWSGTGGDPPGSKNTLRCTTQRTAGEPSPPSRSL